MLADFFILIYSVILSLVALEPLVRSWNLFRVRVSVIAMLFSVLIFFLSNALY